MVSLLGVALIAIGLIDIFQVVLLPQGGVGLISSHLMNIIPRGCVAVTRWMRRPNLLAYSGPILVVATVALWFTLVWLGLAFVCWPMLGDSIVSASGQTPTSFATAIYHSGFNLTTLGTGDLIPKSDHARLVTVASAALGFSLLTLSLSYLNSVYSVVRDRCRFALALHDRAGGTGDPAELLRFWIDTGPAEVSKTIDDLCDYVESHRFYPILHGFLFPDAKYDMSAVMSLILDSTTRGVLLLDNFETARRPDQMAALTETLSTLRTLADSSLNALVKLPNRKFQRASGSSNDAEEVLRSTAAVLRPSIAADSENAQIAWECASTAIVYQERRRDWENALSRLAVVNLANCPRVKLKTAGLVSDDRPGS